MEQRLSIRARMALALFTLTAPPSALALYFLETGSAGRASLVLSVTLALVLALCGPLGGLVASLLMLRDIRKINGFCLEIKNGNYGIRFGLSAEREDEHDLVRLKRNLNWMAHLIDNRENRLRLLLEETDWQRREFEALSYVDSLTGLPNRRFFDKKMDDLPRSFPHGSGSFHLMLIDCDKFKRVNDTMGHQAGDGLLGLLGQVIRDCVRKEDFPFRLGGDEFGVFLTCSDTASARIIGERIRTLFRNSNDLGCTLSIGLASLQLSDGRAPNLKGAMAQADAALYQAKHEGGDRTIAR